MDLQRPEAKDRLREANRAEPGGGESSQRLPYLAILALLALAGLYFYANGRGSSSGDNVGTRALAAALGSSASFDLAPALEGQLTNYSVRKFGDATRIVFPPGTGILAAPIYALAGSLDRLSAPALYSNAGVEKAAAVALSLLAVAFFLLLVRGRWHIGTNIAAAALLVAGTPVLTTMSQGLWSHTGELVALALSFLLTRDSRQSRGHAAAAGLAAGFALWCRPTAVLLFPAALAMLETWRERARFALGAACGGIALAVLNLAWFGSPFGAYAGLNQDKFGFLETGGLTNLLGVLASPSRGLLWFFPALLISLIAIHLAKDSPAAQRENRAMIAVTAAVVLLAASYSRWWGGHSVGPRLLAELSLPCAYSFGAALNQARGRTLRVVLFSAAASQIALFSLLHFSPRSNSWNVEVAIDANPAARMSLKDSQLRAALDDDWAYRESGPYFSAANLEQARHGFDWLPLDLTALANARYDLQAPIGSGPADITLHLERLAEEPPPSSSHLRILPPGKPNAVRVCAGESSGLISIGDVPTAKIDTLIQYRGLPTEAQELLPAGYVSVSFANGKQSRFPLRFGSQLILRKQLNLEYLRLRSRFFAGSISAPDALQRQRFTLAGKLRLVSSLQLEMPGDGPSGCLYLLAVSLGRPADSP